MVIVMAIATNWTYREHQSNGLYWKLWPIYCPFDFLHKWGRIQIIVLNKTKNIINNNNKQHSNIFASLSPVTDLMVIYQYSVSMVNGLYFIHCTAYYWLQLPLHLLNYPEQIRFALSVFVLKEKKKTLNRLPKCLSQ